MPVNATNMRKNLYRILDRVAETGEPVEIDRRGRLLLIVPAGRAARLGGLEPHPSYIAGDPDALVHLDWSAEWTP
jgi:antitoxin (DNA-binding transcriptional repressor) of toxin-antitoxin stability system